MRFVFIVFICNFCVCYLRELMAVMPESTPLYLRSAYPLWDPQKASANSGERLLLTPYLDRNYINEARKVAKVGPGLFSDRVASYSGYLTIDKKYNSNLFFWFFPAQKVKPSVNAPVLLWLQGGPGASSLHGLFEEIGPFSCDPSSNDQQNCTLIENPFTWNRNNSLIFIDNPVGTGFSYTEHNDGYATNQSTIAEHLHRALVQFFKMFPEYRKSEFYITGESYAGKYIPSLAYKIHKENTNGTSDKINLKGIAIGNGFTDPETMLQYGDYAYQLGLVDDNTKQEMQLLESQGRKAIQEKHFIDAFYSMSGILSLFIVESKFQSLYNIMDDKFTDEKSYVTYLQSAQIRRALHVGDVEYKSLGVVYYKLIPEFMTTVKPSLEYIINSNNYKVLFYSGQLDVICAYPLSVNLFNNLKFDYSNEYKKAKRKPWYVNGTLAGYLKSAGNFTEVLVRNAGHMVPTDQPMFALDLITKFTTNTLN